MEGFMYSLNNFMSFIAFLSCVAIAEHMVVHPYQQLAAATIKFCSSAVAGNLGQEI